MTKNTLCLYCCFKFNYFIFNLVFYCTYFSFCFALEHDVYISLLCISDHLNAFSVDEDILRDAPQKTTENRKTSFNGTYVFSSFSQLSYGSLS